ncbi:putative receptor-like protein kinase [Quercus suber]|uniref:non-specific serine/threonine protein kinase n=1 Tax=Quercus suber TaxID=58331 RepID=A0AAW0MD36_QUESU
MFENMGKSLTFSSPLFLFFFTNFFIDSATSSCPIDLSYVETFPWNTTMCREARDPNGTHCCQALLSLFGIGLAQHLKDTSMFQLPDLASSSSCLSSLQNKLEALSIQPSLVPQCLGSATNFVANTSQCAGIITIQDWNQRVNGTTQLDSSCQGDMTGLVRCGSCVDAGKQVNSQLANFDPNNTQKCFYFTVIYAAGIANEFGPNDVRTASCILGIPLSSSASNKSGNHLSRTTQLKLIFGLLGAIVGVLLALGVIILYRRWNKKERQNDVHEEYVSSVKSSVLPNAGAKWFRVSELEQATDGFSQRNLIGQGAYGVVYKGTLSDGTLVAVKQILDLESTGDEDFRNEVEIISKIRHRNLLALRGCCVTSDNLKGKRRFLVYDFMSNGNLEKSDVYSFGIVILEIMSGRKALDTSNSSILLITDWAWMHAKSGNMDEIFDESIREEGPKGVMERFVQVGILCAHVMVAFRPTIAEALKMLEGDIDIPRIRDRPLPLSHESFRSSWRRSISKER